MSLIESVLPKGEHEIMRKEASNIACSLIGALSVARMIDDRKASNDVMNSVKERILSAYEDKY